MQFERQRTLIGEDGQKKLEYSTVTVVGAGGLGAPVLHYLAAAGIGHIKIIDYDIVTESNLNRQILYTFRDIGALKAQIAEERLSKQYPATVFEGVTERVTDDESIWSCLQADLIVCCVDSLEARFSIERLALKYDIPVVDAGIAENDGYVMAVRKGTACIGCVTGDVLMQRKHSPQVIGATAGVIGSIQAKIAIDIVLGEEEHFGKYYAVGFTPLSMQTYLVMPLQGCSVCQCKKKEMK